MELYTLHPAIHPDGLEIFVYTFYEKPFNGPDHALQVDIRQSEKAILYIMNLPLQLPVLSQGMAGGHLDTLKGFEEPAPLQLHLKAGYPCLSNDFSQKDFFLHRNYFWVVSFTFNLSILIYRPTHGTYS